MNDSSRKLAVCVCCTLFAYSTGYQDQAEIDSCTVSDEYGRGLKIGQEVDCDR